MFMAASVGVVRAGLSCHLLQWYHNISELEGVL